METALTRLVGVRHPIVQTGMGWVAGPRLVSATANAGALGVLASATMTTDRLRDAIREVRSRTREPFGVNLRADAADAGDRVRIMIEEGVRVASFALAPSAELIAELKEAGVVVIPSKSYGRRAPCRSPRAHPRHRLRLAPRTHRRTPNRGMRLRLPRQRLQVPARTVTR